METEKMWSECSEEERKEVSDWEKRLKTFKKEVSKGYYTMHGRMERKKEFKKELNRIEKKYQNDNEGQLTLF